MNSSEEDRTELWDVAERFATDHFTVADLRHLRDGGAGAAEWIVDRWAKMAELGWAGLLIPEVLSGSGGSLADMGVVLEVLGSRLAVTPIIPTAIVLPELLMAGGTPDQQADLLPRISGGSCRAALAVEESSRFDQHRIESRAEWVGTGFRLTGVKRNVVGGSVADVFLVSASEESGPSLFLVDSRAPGIEVVSGTLIDSQPVATVRFSEVLLNADSRLGGAGAGADLLARGLDLAALATAAELVGAARQALAMTVSYLKARIQFGVPIGAYQALQHRAARLHCDIELAQCVVRRAVEAPIADRPRLASAAKALAGETALRVGEEGVQMHGGIGMTDEADIGFYLKQARVGELLYGDGGYHRDRFGTLGGY